MSRPNDSTPVAYFHPADPAGWLRPDEPFVVDGLDWSWAFVVHRPVDGFPGYCVGSDGTAWTAWERYYTEGIEGSRVRIGPAWTKLRGYFNGHRRFVVSVYRDSKASSKFLHRLVLEAFLGPCPPGKQCCHFNDDGTNNRLENLRWDTSKANSADAYRNKRIKIGERHHQSKLTEDQVREIREVYARGDANQEQIANFYGMTQISISAIVRGVTWAESPGPIAHPTPTRIDPSTAERALKLVGGGMSQGATAIALGIGIGSVNRIVRGKYHPPKDHDKT